MCETSVNNDGLFDDRLLDDDLDNLRLGDLLLDHDSLSLRHHDLLNHHRRGLYLHLLDDGDRLRLSDHDLLGDDRFADLYFSRASASRSKGYETKGNKQLFDHESSPFVGDSIDKLRRAVTL